MTAPRPTAADLAAARDRTIPDIIAPGLRVLFAGINPGLYSAATGYHFARPGNRFWPALHQSGFTPRQLRPSEQGELLGLGLGITNVAPRATARAAELSAAELRAGAAMLAAKVAEFGPAVAGGARGHRVPDRVRPGRRGGRAAAGPHRAGPAVGAAQPERAQRTLESSSAR